MFPEHDGLPDIMRMRDSLPRVFCLFLQRHGKYEVRCGREDETFPMIRKGKGCLLAQSNVIQVLSEGRGDDRQL